MLIDKALLLDALVERIEDRQVRLSQAQGQAMGAVIELALGGLGVPVTPGVRAVVAGLLQQAGRGDVLAVSPATAEQARAEIQAAKFADERGLPAPVEDIDQQPAELGVVVTEPAPADEPEEVVDAEVVEAVPDPVPRPFLEAYKGNEQIARAKWEQKRNEAARARKEAEQQATAFTSYRPSVHRGFGDIFQSGMRNPPGAG